MTAVFIFVCILFQIHYVVSYELEKTVCDGGRVTLECGPYQRMRINTATYYNVDCGTQCSPDNAVNVIREICDHEHTCSFPCEHYMWDSTCLPGKKCVTINYSCVPCEEEPVEYCDINEEYVECRNPCPEMCRNPSIPQNTACIKSCFPPGCQCLPGYLRDRKTGKCLHPSFCHLYGENNEYFDNCRAGRQIYCQKCEPGYICRNGFVRDRSTGKCIKSCSAVEYDRYEEDCVE